MVSSIRRTLGVFLHPVVRRIEGFWVLLEVAAFVEERPVSSVLSFYAQVRSNIEEGGA